MRTGHAPQRRVPARARCQRGHAGADSRPVSSAHVGRSRRGVSIRGRRAKGRAHLGAENHGVRPLDFPLLSDENIAPDVVAGARRAAICARRGTNSLLVDLTSMFSNAPPVSVVWSSPTTWLSVVMPSAPERHFRQPPLLMSLSSAEDLSRSRQVRRTSEMSTPRVAGRIPLAVRGLQWSLRATPGRSSISSW